VAEDATAAAQLLHEGRHLIVGLPVPVPLGPQVEQVVRELVLQPGVEVLVEAVEVLGGQHGPQPLALALPVIAAAEDELFQGLQAVLGQGVLEARVGGNEPLQGHYEHLGQLEVGGLGQ